MKYSVIIPVFNKAATVGEAVESVLSQTVDDFEIIVVNDGSTDNLIEILSYYKNIKVINQKNGGVSAARNAGIKCAQGDYICFLDADDLWHPNHLETLDKMINLFPNEKFYITSHGYSINDKGRGVLKNYDEIFLCQNLFELTNLYTDAEIVNTNSVCVNRKFLVNENLLFAVGEKIGEDVDMWYRIALRCPAIISKAVTTIYRRELSTATRLVNSTFDWIFARRLKEIKHSDFEEIRKKGAQIIIEQYHITCARDYLTLRRRKDAMHRLNLVKYKNKRYYITMILCYLPYFASRQILKLQKFNRVYAES